MNLLQNGLMAQFTLSDQAWLLKKARIVHFKTGDVLGTPATSSPEVFFLTSGAVALFVCKKTSDPNTGLAVGLIGSEGAVGLQAALGLGAGNFTLLVQSPGCAYVLDGQVLQTLIRRKTDFLLICSRYLWSVYQTISSLAAISQTQDVRVRFANWLLLSAERCQPNPLVITHAHIAQMLGVRRASITLVAREMKMVGIIGYSRGMVNIKKMDALQRIAHV